MKTPTFIICSLMLLSLLFVGCAHVVSSTSQANKDGTTTTTRMSATTFFDAHADLAKGANHVTDKTSGTTISGLDQTSTASNIVAIIDSAAKAAIAVKAP